jgi:hypothetical protein
MQPRIAPGTGSLDGLGSLDTPACAGTANAKPAASAVPQTARP